MPVAEIKKFLLNFEISGNAWPSLRGTLPIAHLCSFTNVTHLMVKEGTYTPNNDYLYLAQNIPADNAPNFIFLMTPGMVVLTLMSAGSPMYNAIPVNKTFLSMLPLSPATYKVDSIYLEGRPASSPLAMAQGVPVDYFFMMAQATF